MTDTPVGSASVDEPKDSDSTKDERTPAAPELPGGRALPKTGKSEQTRALILETAMRLFKERGYDKTTMRAIAAEAGVSVGNAYYYFASKELQVRSSTGSACVAVSSRRPRSVQSCGAAGFGPPKIHHTPSAAAGSRGPALHGIPWPASRATAASASILIMGAGYRPGTTRGGVSQTSAR
ncbi:hypothetical protein A6A07_05860 [Streptomyces sp. CB03911]|nr:hypothetical protein A6A07_05860 [Streptomyces sp. CB03911]